jgi:hypothetical protein
MIGRAARKWPKAAAFSQRTYLGFFLLGVLCMVLFYIRAGANWPDAEVFFWLEWFFCGLGVAGFILFGDGPS